MKKITSYMTISLFLVICSSGIAQEIDKSLDVIHISEHVIKVQALYVELIAINTKKGIVILNSLWSNKVATECRRVIEKAFNRSEFAYVIYLSERVDFIGGTNAFPNSANIYDSLGEACMRNGDNEQAIKNYRKSLELNPDNQNAVEMLKKLKKLVLKNSYSLNIRPKTKEQTSPNSRVGKIH